MANQRSDAASSSSVGVNGRSVCVVSKLATRASLGSVRGAPVAVRGPGIIRGAGAGDDIAAAGARRAGIAPDVAANADTPTGAGVTGRADTIAGGGVSGVAITTGGTVATGVAIATRGTVATGGAAMAAGAVATGGAVTTGGGAEVASAGELAAARAETLGAGMGEAAGREAGMERGTATLSDSTGINDSGTTDT